MGICFHVNPDDLSLQPLERQTYGIKTKTKGLGFGGSRASYAVPGAASTVRFPAGKSHSFAIRMSSKDTDVSSTLKLVPLTVATPSRK